MLKKINDRLLKKLRQEARAKINDALSVSSGVANSYVYKNTRYATGRFSRSQEKKYTESNLYVEGELRFKAKSPGAKYSYAIALDRGHRLVFFGKPTNRYVKGKHYLAPAYDAGKKVLIGNVKK